MSQNVRSDTGGIDAPATGETRSESLEFDVLCDSAATDRWPQLQRGYSSNDFDTIRATVAVEWDEIDHEDLAAEPAELLDCAEGE